MMEDDIPYWVQFDSNDIPRNAVVGGKYKEEIIFVGRAYHHGKELLKEQKFSHTCKTIEFVCFPI